MKSLLSILFSLLSIYMLFAQSDIQVKEQTLSVAGIEADKVIFIRALKEAHPGLTTYLTEQELDSIQQHLMNSELISAAEVYSAFKKVLAAIKDGHTDMSPGKNSSIGQTHILPFRYRIIGNQVFVTEVIGESSFELPAELISVNGISTKLILAKLYQHTSADGGRANFKEAYNEKIFGRQFSIYFPSSKSYVIDLIPLNGQQTTLQVDGIADSLIHPKKYEKVPLSFELSSDGTYGKLTLTTFQYALMKSADLDFHEFLKDCFKELKKKEINHLIIDIRENYGGDNILGLSLYTYFAKEDFRAMMYSESKLWEPITDAAFTNYPNGEYYYLNSHNIKQLDDEWISLMEGIESKDIHENDKIYQGPNKKMDDISKLKFDGKVYLLTSSLTFSAASIFASLAKNNNDAVLIGQETGSARAGFCAGGFLTVTLPNTGFNLQIPMLKRYPFSNTIPPKGEGVLPHHLIEKAEDHLSKENDPEMKKAIELIQQSIATQY